MTIAVVIPFVKLFIVSIANNMLTDRISISAGTNMLNNILPSLGFLVAAYIIHYGVNLQDEVDHTL